MYICTVSSVSVNSVVNQGGSVVDDVGGVHGKAFAGCGEDVAGVRHGRRVRLGGLHGAMALGEITSLVFGGVFVRDFI